MQNVAVKTERREENENEIVDCCEQKELEESENFPMRHGKMRGK